MEGEWKVLKIIEITNGVNGINELYKIRNNNDSLVVLFPGGNYSCEKPLLYYARKVAIEAGHDVLTIAYSKMLSKNDICEETINIVSDEVFNTMKNCNFEKYKNIYFISKSIGTEVAGNIASRLGYERVKSLYLTPIRGTIKHILKFKCIAVVGTKDKFFTDDCIDLIKKIKHVDLTLFEDANHSLEIYNDIDKTINIINNISKLYIKFLSE